MLGVSSGVSYFWVKHSSYLCFKVYYKLSENFLWTSHNLNKLSRFTCVGLLIYDFLLVQTFTEVRHRLTLVKSRIYLIRICKRCFFAMVRLFKFSDSSFRTFIFENHWRSRFHEFWCFVKDSPANSKSSNSLQNFRLMRRENENILNITLSQIRGVIAITVSLQNHWFNKQACAKINDG